MFYVYLLRSINFPDQIYIGFIEDLKARLRAHNAGESLSMLLGNWSAILLLRTSVKHKNSNIISRQVLEKHLLRSDSGNIKANKLY